MEGSTAEHVATTPSAAAVSDEWCVGWLRVCKQGAHMQSVSGGSSSGRRTACHRMEQEHSERNAQRLPPQGPKACAALITCCC